MAGLRWLAALLLLTSSGGIAAERREVDAPKSFLGLLHEGQGVIVYRDDAGFRLAMGAPDSVSRSDDAAIQHKEAVLEAAKADYDDMLRLNQIQPNTVPAGKLRQLTAKVKEAALVLENARNAIRSWEVFIIGDDYVGLRDTTEEMFIPVTSIRAITRAAAKHTSKSSESR